MTWLVSGPAWWILRSAHAAATLHLLSGGRALLGIGPGERENNEPYGIDWRRPVARFEEAVATIRALWDSNGAPASLIREMFVTGTPAEIVGRIAHWRDHGLRYAVLLSMGPFHPSLVEGLRTSIPFSKVLRSLRKL